MQLIFNVNSISKSNRLAIGLVCISLKLLKNNALNEEKRTHHQDAIISTDRSTNFNDNGIE